MMKNIENKIHNTEKGQGIIELLVVVVFILVPFTLGAAYLSRVGDLKHKNIEASRYIAWEKTVWSETGANIKALDDLSQEAAKRIFGHSDTPLHSINDSQPIDANNFSIDPYLVAWDSRFNGRSGMLLSVSNDSSKLSETTENKLNIDYFGGGSIGSVVQGAIDVFQEHIDIQNNESFINTEFSIYTYKKESWWKQWRAGLGSEFNDLIMTENNALYLGSWHADSSEDVVNSIEKSTIAGQPGFSQMIDFLEQTKKIPGFDVAFPELVDLELGDVQPDIVSCERLSEKGDCVNAF